MQKFSEGEVVIVGTGQAGTIWFIKNDIVVLLTCGEIWYGMDSQLRYPQDQADLDACPLNADRFATR